MISDIGEVTVKVKVDFSELAKQFREMADKLDPPLQFHDPHLDGLNG